MPLDTLWCQMFGVMVLMPPIAGALAIGMRTLRRVERDARTAAIDADRSCAACGERDVPLDPDQVYRCPACGYEGGPGLAGRDARRRREQIRALPPEERSRQAREAIDQARTLLDAAEPELVAFRARLFRRNPYETVRAEVLEDAAPDRPLGWVSEACMWLERAGVALGHEGPSLAPDLEPEMWMNQLGEVDPPCVVADLDRAMTAIRLARAELAVLAEVAR